MCKTHEIKRKEKKISTDPNEATKANNIKKGYGKQTLRRKSKIFSQKGQASRFKVFTLR